MKKYIIFLIIFISTNVFSFPIPKNNSVSFDIIRKNKTIGSVITDFKIEEDKLIIDTTVDIKVKILLFPAYKFHQKTTEIWTNNELI